MTATNSLRIGFIHPDLGLGGAERLVLDAALELQQRGHSVSILTGRHDRSRCFPETRDGTLDIVVHGAHMPRAVFGRMVAPCSIARMAVVSGAAALFHDRFDLIICDLVSHAIPILRLFRSTPVLYYCHFPDQLLTPPRKTLYSWYRAPMDRLEQWTTGLATQVIVNSQFTATKFREAFPKLSDVPLEVLHPGVDVGRYPERPNDRPEDAIPASDNREPRLILAVSRFERRKNLALVVKAVAALRAKAPSELFDRVQVVLAGGYDAQLREARVTARELRTLAEDLGVADRVQLRLSPSNTELTELFMSAYCVMHPSLDEHFGIVPVEAMAAGCPVIATASGGPLETVVDGETGCLRAPDPDVFAAALLELLLDPERARRMGKAGRLRAEQEFSRSRFGDRFEAACKRIFS